MQLKLPRDLDCIHIGGVDGLPVIRPVAAARLAAFLASLSPQQAMFLSRSGFEAKDGQSQMLPEEGGGISLVFGLGDDSSPYTFGAAAKALPAGQSWRLPASIDDAGISRATLIFGFCLGAYRFLRHQTGPVKAAAVLVLTPEDAAAPDILHALRAARAVWLARDLINEPANHLGPAELAEAARQVLTVAGAHARVITNTTLIETYPTIHAVGCGSARPPAVLVARWSAAGPGGDAPLVSICGKGICFDTGGYNLKPAVNMLRMKKDMGGAAIALALAFLITESQLPCRLELRLACAENMVSANAMRPLDIVKTRSGLTVEVGNTDAEGRLVLCDIVAEACEANPEFLLDFATLTGAARVALGPDVPALFCNDDAFANMLIDSGNLVHDPVWRLPLWAGYKSWLESNTGDLNNVSDKAYAGAIIAALFLQRFVSDGVRWAHFDVYAWNDQARPGRPAGGECQAMLAAFAALKDVVRSASETARAT